MLRRILVITALLFANIVYAGVYEDALAKNDKVFLFLYSQNCRTCEIFNPVYEKLKAENKNFGFVKVNAETRYGSHLMYKFRGIYVPYIILTDSKTGKSVNISHSCVMNEACLIRAMKSFNGQK